MASEGSCRHVPSAPEPILVAWGRELRKLLILQALMFALGFVLQPQRTFANDLDEALGAHQRGDYKAALLGFQRLADEGLAESQFLVGHMYDKGLGVRLDYKAALRWYRKAADQGLAQAQLILAFMYDSGLGITPDYKAAVKWYRMAANQGLAEAQHNLGYMYQEGLGVQRDYVKAYMWLALASIDDKESATARDLLAKQMTPSQIHQGVKRTREWKSTVIKRADGLCKSCHQRR